MAFVDIDAQANRCKLLLELAEEFVQYRQLPCMEAIVEVVFAWEFGNGLKLQQNTVQTCREEERPEWVTLLYPCSR